MIARLICHCAARARPASFNRERSLSLWFRITARGDHRSGYSFRTCRSRGLVPPIRHAAEIHREDAADTFARFNIDLGGRASRAENRFTTPLSLSPEKSPRFAPRVKPRARARAHDRLCRSNRRRSRSRFAKEAERSRERKSNKILKNPRLPGRLSSTSSLALRPAAIQFSAAIVPQLIILHRRDLRRPSTRHGFSFMIFKTRSSIPLGAFAKRVRGTASSRERQSDFIPRSPKFIFRKRRSLHFRTETPIIRSAYENASVDSSYLLSLRMLVERFSSAPMTRVQATRSGVADEFFRKLDYLLLI